MMAWHGELASAAKDNLDEGSIVAVVPDPKMLDWGAPRNPPSAP